MGRGGSYVRTNAAYWFKIRTVCQWSYVGRSLRYGTQFSRDSYGHESSRLLLEDDGRFWYKYAMEKGFCSVNNTINERFAQMEKQQLEQRISQLENQNQMMFIAQQMTGVVRYPNGFTWDAGANPFCKTTTTTPTTGA